MYFQTFFNSESVRMIELYLKERKNTNSQNWLFSNNKDDSKQCNKNTFSESLKIICRKLDIKNITPKSLRRYFNTILKRNKIDFEIRERLMGHKVEISKGSAYDEFLNDDYKLAKFYNEKVEPITLLGNGNKRVGAIDKRVNELEQLNKNLISELGNTNKKIDNISRLLLTVFAKAYDYEMDDLDNLTELRVNRVYDMDLTEQELKKYNEKENKLIQNILQIKKDLK